MPREDQLDNVILTSMIPNVLYFIDRAAFTLFPDACYEY